MTTDVVAPLAEAPGKLSRSVACDNLRYRSYSANDTHGNEQRRKNNRRCCWQKTPPCRQTSVSARVDLASSSPVTAATLPLHMLSNHCAHVMSGAPPCCFPFLRGPCEARRTLLWHTSSDGLGGFVGKNTRRKHPPTLRRAIPSHILLRETSCKTHCILLDFTCHAAHIPQWL